MRYQLLKPAGTVAKYLARERMMMEIIIDLAHHLYNEKGIISVAIKLAIERGRPKDAIIKTVFDNITDNEPLMISILSNESVQGIKSFYNFYFKH